MLFELPVIRVNKVHVRYTRYPLSLTGQEMGFLFDKKLYV